MSTFTNAVRSSRSRAELVSKIEPLGYIVDKFIRYEKTYVVITKNNTVYYVPVVPTIKNTYAVRTCVSHNTIVSNNMYSKVSVDYDGEDVFILTPSSQYGVPLIVHGNDQIISRLYDNKLSKIIKQDLDNSNVVLHFKMCVGGVIIFIGAFIDKTIQPIITNKICDKYLDIYHTPTLELNIQINQNDQAIYDIITKHFSNEKCPPVIVKGLNVYDSYNTYIGSIQTTSFNHLSKPSKNMTCNSFIDAALFGHGIELYNELYSLLIPGGVRGYKEILEARMRVYFNREIKYVTDAIYYKTKCIKCKKTSNDLPLLGHIYSRKAYYNEISEKKNIIIIANPQLAGVYTIQLYVKHMESIGYSTIIPANKFSLAESKICTLAEIYQDRQVIFIDSHADSLWMIMQSQFSANVIPLLATLDGSLIPYIKFDKIEQESEQIVYTNLEQGEINVIFNSQYKRIAVIISGPDSAGKTTLETYVNQIATNHGYTVGTDPVAPHEVSKYFAVIADQHVDDIPEDTDVYIIDILPHIDSNILYRLLCTNWNQVRNNIHKYIQSIHTHHRDKCKNVNRFHKAVIHVQPRCSSIDKMKIHNAIGNDFYETYVDPIVTGSVDMGPAWKWSNITPLFTCFVSNDKANIVICQYDWLPSIRTIEQLMIDYKNIVFNKTITATITQSNARHPRVTFVSTQTNINATIPDDAMLSHLHTSSDLDDTKYVRIIAEEIGYNFNTDLSDGCVGRVNNPRTYFKIQDVEAQTGQFMASFALYAKVGDVYEFITNPYTLDAMYMDA